MELQPITIEQGRRLTELECIIRRGINSFIEVGTALMEVSDKELFVNEFQTFEAYCKKKWNISPQYGNRLIGAAKVVKNLETIVSKPVSEAQCRPLTKLEPAQQVEAFSAATEANGGKQPTAKQVAAAVEKIKPAKPAPLPRYIPANGLQYASQAILSLEQIQPNDTQREAALNKVAQWLENNRQKTQ